MGTPNISKNRSIPAMEIRTSNPIPYEPGLVLVTIQSVALGERPDYNDASKTSSALVWTVTDESGVLYELTTGTHLTINNTRGMVSRQTLLLTALGWTPEDGAPYPEDYVGKSVKLLISEEPDGKGGTVKKIASIMKA